MTVSGFTALESTTPRLTNPLSRNRCGINIGEGAAISTAMIPFLLAAIMVSWFGLQRRKWQQGGSDD